MNFVYLKLVAFWVIVAIVLSVMYYRDKYLDALVSIETTRATAIAEQERLNREVDLAYRKIEELQRIKNAPIDTKNRRDFE